MVPFEGHYLYRIFYRCAECGNEYLLFQWTQKSAEIKEDI